MFWISLAQALCLHFLRLSHVRGVRARSAENIPSFHIFVFQSRRISSVSLIYIIRELLEKSTRNARSIVQKLISRFTLEHRYSHGHGKSLRQKCEFRGAEIRCIGNTSSFELSWIDDEDTKTTKWKADSKLERDRRGGV